MPHRSCQPRLWREATERNPFCLPRAGATDVARNQLFVSCGPRFSASAWAGCAKLKASALFENRLWSRESVPVRGCPARRPAQVTPRSLRRRPLHRVAVRPAHHGHGCDSARADNLAAILSGNLPPFLRTLVPIALDYHAPDGKTLIVTLFVMPEYLAIGSDRDFLRMPMTLHTAFAVASRMGFVLPTRKIVDAIYRQSGFHFSPEPMTPGPQMGSTEYYRVHNEKIEAQSPARAGTPGMLVSGHKKDVVISPRLTANPEKLAIYGWHQGMACPSSRSVRSMAPVMPITVTGSEW